MTPTASRCPRSRAPSSTRCSRAFSARRRRRSSRTAIFERSEGNAFIAEELLAGAAEGGLPATLRDVLLTRLAALDESSRRLVRVAAAIGRRVDHRLLAAVAGLPEQDLLEALREAVRHHLLVADDGSPTASVTR